jgi:M6 family metalloprotease-like protein
MAVTVSPAALPRFDTPTSTGFAFQLARPAWADERTPSGFPHVGEWPKTPGVFHAGTEPLRGGVLFVDFEDHPGAASAVTPEEATSLLASASSPWYAEASYGRLDLTFEAIPGWHRMAKPAGDYGLAQCCDLAKARAFVEEAVAKADADGADFSGFDALWVVVPTTAEEHFTILIDVRWPGDGIAVDGNEVRKWITAPASYPSVPTQVEPARFSHWVATHEIGHFLGLPDLYLKPPGCPTCPNTFEPVGYWDLMSEVPLHAHFLSWHKWLLGWLDSAQMRLLDTPGALEETLTPLAAPGGVKAVVAPLTASTAYVVEAREPMGWESGLCDRGVLVYTVDSTKRNAEGPVQLKPASSPPASSSCGPTWQPGYDTGPGEDSVYEDPASGVRVDVLQRNDDGSYRVRVTRS